MQQGLAYVNGAGNAIIKVDNTTGVAQNEKRNTVRITTSDSYNYGSLWVIDLLHIPFGCSVSSSYILCRLPQLNAVLGMARVLD